jgi:dihydrofolate reductase
MNLIFSADENWGIGKKGDLLYRIAPAMMRFKEKTTGGAVVMGRKTLKSLPDGKPLHGRANIVLTRDPEGFAARSCQQSGCCGTGQDEAGFAVCRDLAVFAANQELGERAVHLDLAKPAEHQDFPKLTICRNLAELSCCLRKIGFSPDRVWVIGGGEILRLLAPYCHEAHVTRILCKDADADTWTEDLGAIAGWRLAEEGEVSEWQGLRYRYDRYENSMERGLPMKPYSMR